MVTCNPARCMRAGACMRAQRALLALALDSTDATPCTTSGPFAFETHLRSYLIAIMTVCTACIGEARAQGASKGGPEPQTLPYEVAVSSASSGLRSALQAGEFEFALDAGRALGGEQSAASPVQAGSKALASLLGLLLLLRAPCMLRSVRVACIRHSSSFHGYLQGTPASARAVQSQRTTGNLLSTPVSWGLPIHAGVHRLHCGLYAGASPRELALVGQGSSRAGGPCQRA